MWVYRTEGVHCSIPPVSFSTDVLQPRHRLPWKVSRRQEMKLQLQGWWDGLALKVLGTKPEGISSIPSPRGRELILVNCVLTSTHRSPQTCTHTNTHIHAEQTNMLKMEGLVLLEICGEIALIFVLSQSLNMVFRVVTIIPEFLW